MMDASLFILLPTGDEVIGLPLTEEGLRDLVAPLMSVKKYARQNGINLRIFFDKDNVKRFKTDVGGVVDKAAYLSNSIRDIAQFCQFQQHRCSEECYP